MDFVRISLKENKTGSFVVFLIVAVEGEPYGVRVRFREFGTLVWGATAIKSQPVVGDTITVDGLADGAFYEFYPVAVSEEGIEGLPGNIVRVRVAAADTVTQLRNAITATLTYFIPSQNISYEPATQSIPHDKDYPTAYVRYLGRKDEKILNCCRFSVHRFRVLLRQEGLSRIRREENLTRHLEEMVRFFEEDLTPFSAVEGYYDTRVVGVETGAFAQVETASVSLAGFIIECVVRS